MPNTAINGITIFSGGTAANALVDVFDQLTKRRKCSLTYIIPISDNGGSSSELIRMFGGPSVGDLRSRLVRLIPNPDDDEERRALKSLFEYRLVADASNARAEWLDIVEARHELWQSISSSKRELIRAVLNTLNLEIVKRARPSSVFNFAEASVGNLFLTGARLFSGSFESAIYLLSMICSIPHTISVLPAINSNFTHHIAAGLLNGSQIVGQVAISHPSAPTSVPDTGVTENGIQEVDIHDRIEDANLPGSLPGLRGRYAAFSKHDIDDDLPCRIDRVWYINPYGHEIWPVANPKVIEALQSSRTIIYSIGSLYTSIIPSVILRGVGSAIADTSDNSDTRKRKILILNASIDRETGPRSEPMSAVEFVLALCEAAGEDEVVRRRSSDHGCGVSKIVTHLIFPERADRKPSVRGIGMPVVDVAELEKLGVVSVPVAGKKADAQHGEESKMGFRYDELALREALEEIMDGD